MLLSHEYVCVLIHVADLNKKCKKRTNKTGNMVVMEDDSKHIFGLQKWRQAFLCRLFNGLGKKEIFTFLLQKSSF